MAQVISTRELASKLGALGYANLIDVTLFEWLRANNISARDLIKYVTALAEAPGVLDDASVACPAEVRDAIRKMLQERGYLAL